MKKYNVRKMLAKMNGCFPMQVDEAHKYTCEQGVKPASITCSARMSAREDDAKMMETLIPDPQNWSHRLSEIGLYQFGDDCEGNLAISTFFPKHIKKKSIRSRLAFTLEPKGQNVAELGIKKKNFAVRNIDDSISMTCRFKTGTARKHVPKPQARPKQRGLSIKISNSKILSLQHSLQNSPLLSKLRRRSPKKANFRKESDITPWNIDQ